MSMRDLFRLRVKENPAVQAILAVFGSGQAVWTEKDYYKLIVAGYKEGTPVYGCTKLIARAAAGIPWVVYRKASGGPVKEPREHPLLDLLRRPNPDQGGRLFFEAAVSDFLLAGNVYIYRNGIGKQAPKELYTLRPDRVKVLMGRFPELIGGYRYEVGGEKKDFGREEVLHVKEFNPTDDFYGLSRLIVASKRIDIANWSAEWNLKMLQNEMRPSFAMIFDRLLDPKQRKRLEEELKQKYQGAENARMPLIVEGGAGGAKVQTLSLSPVDADWQGGEKANLRATCVIFGVASELMGDSENKTYSNVQEARQALYMETVLPIMDVFRDEFNNWLTPLFGDRFLLDYDRDAIDALQENRGEKYAYITAADFMKINEKRMAVGLEEVGPEGDVILVPIGRVPLESLTAEPEEPEPEPVAAEPEEEPPAGLEELEPKLRLKGFWQDRDRQKVLWQSFDTRLRARERSFDSLAKGYLKAQAARIREHLAGVASLAAVNAPGLLDLQAEAKLYAKTFRPWYQDHFIRAGHAGMVAAKGEIFDDAEFKAGRPRSWLFHLTPELEERLEEMIFNSGTAVNEATIDDIFKTLKLANRDNLTVEEFTQNIVKRVEEFAVWRSRLWARTEAAKVDNWGQLEGYKQTEFVERKGWLCSRTKYSRDGHIQAADRYTAEPIPLSEPFIVNNDATGEDEELMFPGDPAGGPGNVCNCACSVFPETEKAEE